MRLLSFNSDEEVLVTTGLGSSLRTSGSWELVVILASPVFLLAVASPGPRLREGPDPGTDSAAEDETVPDGPAAVFLLGVLEEALVDFSAEVTSQECGLLATAPSLAADHLQPGGQTEVSLQQLLVSLGC